MVATLENTLPYTVGGKEADYRKDESGNVNPLKILNGVKEATTKYNFNAGAIFSAENWNNFLAECQKQGQDVSENRAYITAEERSRVHSTSNNPVVRFFSGKAMDTLTQQA